MLFKNGRYANVASTLALVVAMGGTSYAAVAIAKNSVGSPQIINSSVKSVDVKNGSLKGVDFKAGELTGGAAGPAGPAGATGPAGPAGATGPAGPAGAAGTARAYAMVTGGATPVLSRTKAVTAVTHVGTGSYCLTVSGIDTTQVSYVASVDWFSTVSPEGNATAMPRPGLCPSGQLGVMTERIPGAGGSSTTADDVGFLIVVP